MSFYNAIWKSCIWCSHGDGVGTQKSCWREAAIVNKHNFSICESASEMTYIVSGVALNSTQYSLTHSICETTYGVTKELHSWAEL